MIGGVEKDIEAWIGLGAEDIRVAGSTVGSAGLADAIRVKVEAFVATDACSGVGSDALFAVIR